MHDRPFPFLPLSGNTRLAMAARPLAPQLLCLALFALACSDDSSPSTASGDDFSLSSTGGTAGTLAPALCRERERASREALAPSPACGRGSG